MAAPNPILALRRAARNSPWLVMSILAHAILLVWLGLMVIRKEGRPEEPDIKGIVITKQDVRELPPEIPLPVEIIRTTIPEDQIVEIVDLDKVVPDIPLAAPEDVDLTQEIGNPDSLDLLPTQPHAASSGIGVGTGAQFGDGPTGEWRKRQRDLGLPPGKGERGRPPDRMTVGIDKAVREGLLWLCRHQSKDGSWGALSMRSQCVPGSPCFDEKLQANAHYDEGLTSLALLAFLGAGITHKSQASLVDTMSGKRYAAGDVVERGLRWLKDRQNPDGSFSRDRAFLYNEALATMALSEAYGMTGARFWREPAQRGVAFLQAAQRPSPTGSGRWGWRYASRQEIEDYRQGTGDENYAKELHDSDTSVTAWCVMALKSAQLSKLEVDPASLEGAMAFCEFVTGTEGLVGYLDAKSAGLPVTGPFSDRFDYHATAMSALGACIRIFSRHDAQDPFLDLAAKRIVGDLPKVEKDGASVDYYYWYYASLALHQLDGEDSPRRTGKYWSPWYKAVVDALIALQDQRDKKCSEGGWLAADRWGSYSGGGPLYATALNVLTLEVTFRYPNAFGAKLR